MKKPKRSEMCSALYDIKFSNDTQQRDVRSFYKRENSDRAGERVRAAATVFLPLYVNTCTIRIYGDNDQRY